MSDKAPFLSLHHADCLDVLRSTPDAAIDLILCDLPYGNTGCSWDRMIDPEVLWREFKRILTPTGTLLAFGVQPFITRFAAPAVDLLKYNLIWRKPKPTGHLHVRNRPRSTHEDIFVFSRGACIHQHATKRKMTYNHDGQITPGRLRHSASNVYRMRDAHNDGRAHHAVIGASTSILDYAKDARDQLVHPTQKPVELLRWLIRAYSNPDDLILDPAMGSGSSGVAAVMEGRDFIGIELDPDIYTSAEQRIERAARNISLDLVA